MNGVNTVFFNKKYSILTWGLLRNPINVNAVLINIHRMLHHLFWTRVSLSDNIILKSFELTM